MDASGERLALPEDFTIAYVAALREGMLTFIDAGAGDAEIDGAGVDRVDGAGIQLLCAFMQTIQLQGRRVKLVDASSSLQQAITTLGMEDYFK